MTKKKQSKIIQIIPANNLWAYLTPKNGSEKKICPVVAWALTESGEMTSTFLFAGHLLRADADTSHHVDYFDSPNADHLEKAKPTG